MTMLASERMETSRVPYITASMSCIEHVRNGNKGNICRVVSVFVVALFYLVDDSRGINLLSQSVDTGIFIDVHARDPDRVLAFVRYRWDIFAATAVFLLLVFIGCFCRPFPDREAPRKNLASSSVVGVHGIIITALRGEYIGS